MHVFKIKTVAYSIYRYFAPFFIFGQRGDFTVVLFPITAVDIIIYFCWVKWWKHDRTSLPAPEIPAPLSSTVSCGPHWRWGLHWHPSDPQPWPPDFHGIENLRLDRDLGMNKPAEGWKDSCGWGGKAFLRFHLTWKIRMLNRNCPRTITKSGPYHIYSAVVCFPQAKFPPKMSSALWLSPLHPWHCHQEEGLGPLSVCQERSQEEQKLEISFRCLNSKFLCFKRDF